MSAGDGGIEVRLYDATGTVLQRVLASATKPKWSDPLNDVGVGSIQVPRNHADAAALQGDMIVKFMYGGAERFGFVIENLDDDRVTTDRQFRGVSGQGLLSLLDDGILYPYGGLRGKSPSTRNFNFTTKDSPSHNLGVTWEHVHARKQENQTGKRENQPRNWPIPADRWMWATDPNVEVPKNTENWFRFHGTWEPGWYRFWTTADGAYDFFIDGDVIASGADYDPQEEKKPFQIKTKTDKYLSAGVHVLGIRGQNDGSPANSLPGVLISIAKLNSKGRVDSKLKPTYQKWRVTDQMPGWRAGDVLQTVVKEAQDRNVARLKRLSLGFTARKDSAGIAWSTAISRGWNIGDSVLTIAKDLAETGIDVSIDVQTMKLHAWESRGVDRTATIRLHGRNLTGFKVKRTAQIKNESIIATRNGWATRTETSSQEDYGRREVALQLGQQSDPGLSAVQTLVRAFRKMSRPQFTVDADQMGAIAAAHVRPYVDVGVGDTITVPGPSNNYIAARILSISVEQTDTGAVMWTPELEVDS